MNSGVDIHYTEEEALVNALKKGDTEAFEQLLALYEKKIFAFILTIVRRREDAEDLTQDTFIRVYTHRDSLKAEGNFRAFLYTVATHVSYDWFRKKKHTHEFFLIDDDEKYFETIDENDTYVHIENADQLERAFEKLQPGYKTILLLFYYQGFSYDDIAKALSVPLNTVKTNLRRAKLVLRRALESQSV